MAKPNPAATPMSDTGEATRPYRLDGITFHYFDDSGHRIFKGKGMKGAHPDGDLVELTANQAYSLRDHLRTPEGHKIDADKFKAPIVIDEDIDLE